MGKQEKIKFIAIIMILAIACIIQAGLLFFVPQKESVTRAVRTESYISGLLYQESAEVSALYKQAFELAKIKLDEAIVENNGSGNGLYIVTDIDATLMDDSAYFAGALLASEERKKNGRSPWNNKDWAGYYAAVATEAVRPVAGAQEFIEYASAKGVKTFYITNRPFYEMDLTVKQLKNYGFIDEKTYAAYSGLDGLQEHHDFDDVDALADIKRKVDKEGKYELEDGYFTLKGDYTIQVQGLGFSSDKAERRHNVTECIGKNGKIVLYLGDSINDMVSKNEYKYSELTEEDSASFFSGKGNSARKQAVMNELWKDKWGTVFIVMPNAAYGDWLKATWHKKNISETEEMEAIKKQLNENSYLNSKTWYDGSSPVGNTIE